MRHRHITTAPAHRARPRGERLRSLLAGFSAVLLAAGLLAIGSVPAHAALGDLGQITLDKNVNGVSAITTEPGGTFTYNLIVGCDDNPCIDAAVTDPLPPEFAGFTINSVQSNPASAAIPHGLTGCTVGGVITADCTLDARFETPLGLLAGDPQVGIPAGTTYRVSVTLTAPTDLTPAWPHRNTTVVNTATADAVTSVVRDVQDDARVTVDVPIVVDVAPAKSWTPGSQLYNPGQSATFQIGARNTSNVPAESLVLQDPVIAPDAAAGELDASNPFTFVDFVGICAPQELPEGADQVQASLYVRAAPAAAWQWISGPVASAVTLPAYTGEVGGIRLSYSNSVSGAHLVAGGTSSAQCIEVAQRTTNRTTGAALVATGATVRNTVSAAIQVPGEEVVTRTATASLEVGPLNVVVEPGKTITPAQIPAGGTFDVALSARNASNGPLTSLTIAEPGEGSFLSDDLRFAEFGAWSWPAGATSGSIVWHFANTADATAALDSATAPATPALAADDWITGFTLNYLGEIESAASAGATFSVRSDAAMIADAAPHHEDFDNVIRVTGVNPAGTDARTAQDDVRIFFPQIDLEIDKSVRPALVTPGGTVLAELTATTSAESSRVMPTRIVVEDSWDPADAETSFWNAFRAREVSFVDIPSGATLTVQYRTGTAPGSWTTLATAVPSASEPYSADLVAALGAPGADAVTGLRFVFEKADGFAQGTIVKPNLVFQAAGTLRSGGAIAPTVGEPVAYENTATADGEGVSGSLTIVADQVSDVALVRAVDYGTGPGTLLADKRWVTGNWSSDLTTLSAQSGSTAHTIHGWGVTIPGYARVVISDPLPSHETTPASTVFQAFDLTGIRATTFAQDPLLRWDTVSSIEIFVAGSWLEVAAPGGSWMTATGFAGYQPSGAELDTLRSATGVRVTVLPNDAARTASTEPGRPAPGSGVASAATERPLGLIWELRNALRVPSGSHQWVTGTTPVNAADDGVVVNTFRVAADAVVRDESDDVTLLDAPPGVGTAKTAAPASVVVPHYGDVDPADYPSIRYTIDAWNTAASRASYLRVTDPVPCATPTDCVTPANDRDPDVFTGAVYDATTNPFETFTVTNIDFVVAADVPLDQAQSQVALWRYDPGAATTSVSIVSMADAAAADAAALADVVGISVVYQSTEPQTTGGLIPQGTATANTIRLAIDAQLRTHLRSTPATLVAGGARIDNVTLAQSYDPILGTTARPNALADAAVELTAARLLVNATKTASPSTILETDPEVPVTITLGASDGSSTAAPESVSLTDTSAAFWNAFAFAAPGDVVYPQGAERARIDVRLDGESTWVTGSVVDAPASPALPAAVAVSDYERITGIRYVFDTDPTRPFSATVPAAAWSTTAAFTVQLRSGAEFPGSVVNTVDVRAERVGLAASEAAADVTLTMSTGAPRIDVRKEVVAGGTREVQPGEPTPWTLEVRNTGTSFITVTEIVDEMGDHLRYDGTPPSFDASAAPTMPTTGIVVSQSAASNLTLTFPAGAVLAPGDHFVVTVDMILLPGVTAGQQAVNTFWVETDQVFAPGACTNVSGNGQGTLAGLTASQCGTSNFVTTQTGPLLFAEKEVRGEIDGVLVDGATNIVDPELPCVEAPGGFHRSVCVAATVIGATDEWRIGAANTGTIPYQTLTFVDPLPAPGDRLLATGSARGSDWRPVFDLDYAIQPTTTGGITAEGVPSGTVVNYEVTTTPAPCIGTATLSTWPSDVHCAGADWQTLASYSGAAADITGIRVSLDFTGTTEGSLAPGASVHFQYRTLNTPQGADGQPSAGAVTPKLSDGSPERAWNQVGVVAVLDDAEGTTLRRAPERVGVELLSGAVAFEKTISGVLALAPANVTADVACTVPSATSTERIPVALGALVRLEVPTNGSARIDGIPLGAQCSLDESGELGAFGEERRTPSGAQLVNIVVAGGVADAVPAAQTVAVDNRYAAPATAGTGLLSTTGIELNSLVLMILGALLAICLGAASVVAARMRLRHR